MYITYDRFENVNQQGLTWLHSLRGLCALGFGLLDKGDWRADPGERADPHELLDHLLRDARLCVLVRVDHLRQLGDEDGLDLAGEHAPLAVLLPDPGKLLVVGLEEGEPLEGDIHRKVCPVGGVLLPARRVVLEFVMSTVRFTRWRRQPKLSAVGPNFRPSAQIFGRPPQTLSAVGPNFRQPKLSAVGPNIRPSAQTFGNPPKPLAVGPNFRPSAQTFGRPPKLSAVRPNFRPSAQTFVSPNFRPSAQTTLGRPPKLSAHRMLYTYS